MKMLLLFTYSDLFLVKYCGSYCLGDVIGWFPLFGSSIKIHHKSMRIYVFLLLSWLV